jgi:hypothetical protein
MAFAREFALRHLVVKVVQTNPSRGSKSRNKVSVGEPAEGSLSVNFLWKLNDFSR